MKKGHLSAGRNQTQEMYRELAFGSKRTNRTLLWEFTKVTWLYKLWRLWSMRFVKLHQTNAKCHCGFEVKFQTARGTRKSKRPLFCELLLHFFGQFLGNRCFSVPRGTWKRISGGEDELRYRPQVLYIAGVEGTGHHGVMPMILYPAVRQCAREIIHGQQVEVWKHQLKVEFLKTSTHIFEYQTQMWTILKRSKLWAFFQVWQQHSLLVAILERGKYLDVQVGWEMWFLLITCTSSEVQLHFLFALGLNPKRDLATYLKSGKSTPHLEPRKSDWKSPLVRWPLLVAALNSNGISEILWNYYEMPSIIPGWLVVASFLFGFCKGLFVEQNGFEIR